MLGVNVSTLRRWHDRKMGPRLVVVVGKRTGYLRKDIEAWLASREAKQPMERANGQ